MTSGHSSPWPIFGKCLAVSVVVLYASILQFRMPTNGAKLAGDAYASRQQYSRALAAYEQATLNYPTDPTLRLLLARQYLRKGQYDVAEAHLAIGLKLAPEHPEMLIALAEVREKQDPAGGLAAWRDVLTIDPGNWRARLRIGEIMVKQTDFAAASEGFRVLIKERPKDGRVLLDLAQVEALAGPDEALVVAEQASRDQDPQIAANGLQLAATLRQAEGESDPAYVAELIGLTLLRQNQPQLAVAAFAEASRRRPEDLDARAYEALAFQKSGDAEAATVQLRQVLSAKPDHALSHYLLGRVLRSQSQLPEAIAEFRQAIAFGGEDPEVLADLAQTHLEEGDYAAAETQFRRAASLRPGDLAAVLRLAHFYLDRGFRPDRGLEAASVAASLQPENAEAGDLLGWALHLNGRSAEGLTAIRKAIALDREYAPAFYHLGVILEKNQNRQGAEEAYRRASDLAGADPLGERADQALQELLR